MANLNWHEPLERCCSLDEIRAHWHPLLERDQMTPSHPVPRYQDAILAFVGGCRLPTPLKLAAVLALGSAFDIDLRLALGALAGDETPYWSPWPEQVSAAVSDNGPALQVETDDAWLGAFVAGRLAGLRETLKHDGTGIDDWKAAFWNRFLEMACRHGSPDHVRRGLQQNADPTANDYAAVSAPAQGVTSDRADWSACDQSNPSNADYGQVLLQLVDSGLPRQTMLATALPTAAAEGNRCMLDFLLAQGADIHDEGGRALEAAAGHLALEAFEWLLEHGADVNDNGGAVLDAAVGTLDETMVEAVLATGADAWACGNRILHTALTSRPWDLYSAETDFDPWRPAIIALLLRHGACPIGGGLVDALRSEGSATRIVEAVAALVEPGNAGLQMLENLAREAAASAHRDGRRQPGNAGLAPEHP